MKILMLSWEYPPRIVGGIARVVYNLAQKLGEQGNEVHIVTWKEKNDVNEAEDEKDEKVFVHRTNIYDIAPGNFIDWVLHMNFSLLERSIGLFNEIGEFDIIHAHDWLTAFTARALKHSYKAPLVSTIHATEAGRNSGIHNEVQSYINSVEWWLTYESWRVIVNSRYMFYEVKNNFQLPEDKIRIIPNGVNLKKFDNFSRDMQFRNNYAMSNEKIVFFVGRIVNEKGVHILIDAIPKILCHYYDVKFVIAGKGPELDYLHGKVCAMNIEHKVYFTGYISEEVLGKLYKCADIAVFPSLYEPFGIVALEGIMANVPIVVSDAGGLGEIVEHGVDGLKFYSGNPSSLADCILEILFNPEKAEIMKKKALDKVRNIYNWDSIADQTFEVYREITVSSNKVIKIN
ncbi:MAG TPA: glycosyltransferase family 4 protein [Clostridiales bacterium]|nr:glycosyltransferase family 4 protein [Clostridiales bacterium]